MSHSDSDDIDGDAGDVDDSSDSDDAGDADDDVDNGCIATRVTAASSPGQFNEGFSWESLSSSS